MNKKMVKQYHDVTFDKYLQKVKTASKVKLEKKIYNKSFFPDRFQYTLGVAMIKDMVYIYVPHGKAEGWISITDMHMDCNFMRSTISGEVYAFKHDGTIDEIINDDDLLFHFARDIFDKAEIAKYGDLFRNILKRREAEKKAMAV